MNGERTRGVGPELSGSYSVPLSIRTREIQDACSGVTPVLSTQTPDASRPRRLIEGFVLVAVWVDLGYLLPVSAEGYLLIVVPLTGAFQIWFRPTSDLVP